MPRSAFRVSVRHFGLVLGLVGCVPMGGLGRPSASATVVVENGTGTTIQNVYLSDCRSTKWGRDQLGATEVIADGGSASFVVTAGCWDMRARLSGGATVDRRTITLVAGTTDHWTVTRSGETVSSGSAGGSSSAGRTTVVVANRGSSTIYYVYLSACSDNDWGDDWLEDDVIMAGASQSFSMAPGCWDMKAVYDDQREVVRRQVELPASGVYRWDVQP